MLLLDVPVLDVILLDGVHLGPKNGGPGVSVCLPFFVFFSTSFFDVFLLEFGSIFDHISDVFSLIFASLLHHFFDTYF